LKPTGWVVDMRHNLDEETGDLPDAIPERVLSLAIFVGAIVAWLTDHLPGGDEYSNVPCRRSPGRRRCRGEIIAGRDRTSGYIAWHCPLCGDNGLIHGWEDTPWDRQHDTGAVPTIPHRRPRTDAPRGHSPGRRSCRRGYEYCGTVGNHVPCSQPKGPGLRCDG
jgi:hypothetical protein